MVNERRALTRQLQQMFHEHLIGVFHWDDGEIAKPKEAPHRPGQAREAGKFLDQISMRLGPFDIDIDGPDVSPPLGKVSVKLGKHSLCGPLDAKTWRDVANFIKEHNEGNDNGSQTRDDWGR